MVNPNGAYHQGFVLASNRSGTVFSVLIGKQTYFHGSVRVKAMA